MASVIGEVRGSVLLRTRSMPLFEMTVGQGLNTVKCMWFRGSYLQDKFHAGQMVALYGKLEPSRSSAGKFKMIQPQFEILPSHGFPRRSLSRWRWGGLCRCMSRWAGRRRGERSWVRRGCGEWSGRCSRSWRARTSRIPPFAMRRMGHPGCLGRERWTELVFRRLCRRRCEAGWVCRDGWRRCGRCIFLRRERR